MKLPANKGKSKVIETRTNFTFLREDGIVHTVCKKGSEHDLEDAKANLEAIRALAPSLPCLTLVDLTQVKSQSAECRSYYAGPEASKVSHSVALLAKSNISRVIGNFFIGLNKSASAYVRLFSDEKAAVKWLQAQRSGRDSD